MDVLVIILLVASVVCAVIDVVMTKSLLAAAVGLLSAAFLVQRLN